MQLEFLLNKYFIDNRGIGDGDLGIGDGAQAPIPEHRGPHANPQHSLKIIGILLTSRLGITIAIIIEFITCPTWYPIPVEDKAKALNLFGKYSAHIEYSMEFKIPLRNPPRQRDI